LSQVEKISPEKIAPYRVAAKPNLKIKIANVWKSKPDTVEVRFDDISSRRAVSLYLSVD